MRKMRRQKKRGGGEKKIYMKECQRRMRKIRRKKGDVGWK
jgi:hypothetical protein